MTVIERGMVEKVMKELIEVLEKLRI